MAILTRKGDFIRAGNKNTVSWEVIVNVYTWHVKRHNEGI